ncbi:unnamed protein product, partial [Musa hybrid cultivar]
HSLSDGSQKLHRQRLVKHVRVWPYGTWEELCGFLSGPHRPHVGPRKLRVRFGGG